MTEAKWHPARTAPDTKVVIVQARVQFSADSAADERPAPVWGEFMAYRSGPHWDFWPAAMNSRERIVSVRYWTEIPTPPALPKRGMEARLPAMERAARDEELRRQGWMPKRRRPEGTMVVRVLVKNPADYGPYLERCVTAFDGVLPTHARAWRPATQ